MLIVKLNITDLKQKQTNENKTKQNKTKKKTRQNAHRVYNYCCVV